MNTRKIIEYVHQCRWCDFKNEIEKDKVLKALFVFYLAANQKCTPGF